jgi:hypothetical protein
MSSSDNRWCSNGLSFEVSAPLPAIVGLVRGGYQRFGLDDPDELIVLAELLGQGQWAIATLVPCVFGPLARARGLSSPHGALPHGPTPWHAVCLVGVAGRTFRILDPWSCATNQPLALTFEEFATAWTGEVVLVDPSQ